MTLWVKILVLLVLSLMMLIFPDGVLNTRDPSQELVTASGASKIVDWQLEINKTVQKTAKICILV